ncbi:hypothetical protein GCM10027405_02850 [Arthrobacter alkaliphilus]|uniref:SOS response-associated peptidase family protein n=1 Tax=Arthrobacter alkaliphilus TaxID=369936 RepID=UPI001F16BBBF|nr:SOS response-associated peptidase family protein [Arthrobacter alkaliphilus]
MCGRYVVSKSTADLTAAFDVEELHVEELKPSYNLAPTDHWAGLCRDKLVQAALHHKAA